MERIAKGLQRQNKARILPGSIAADQEAERELRVAGAAVYGALVER
jgi:hypothetical protein